MARRAIVLLVAVVSLASAAQAASAVLLADLGLPEGWVSDQWSSARGSVVATPDQPPAAAIPAEAAGGGARVEIDWPGGGQFRFWGMSPRFERGPIPYRAESVSAWARGDGRTRYLEAHFADADGKDQKVGLGVPPNGEWKQLAAAIPADWHQPLTFRSLTWHNWGVQDEVAHTTVTISRLEVTLDLTARLAADDGVPGLVVSATTPHGIAGPDGSCALTVRTYSWTVPAAGLSVSVNGRGGDGASFLRAAIALPTATDSARDLNVRLPRLGCYVVKAALQREGAAKLLAEVRADLAWLAPVPPLAREERLRFPIGVNTHLGAPWEAFEKLGIRWARDYSWAWLGRGDTAPIGNGRDFRLVFADAAAHGVEVLPITMSSFRNAEGSGFLSDSGTIARGFERLSKAFPEIPYWELDNEFELGLPTRWFPEGNYENALASAAEGLKAAGAARLVLNGTAGVRFGEARALLKSDAADAFVVVNSHFYCGTSPPETGISDANLGGEERRVSMTAIDQLRRISRLAHDAGKESWLTEIGWDAAHGPAVGEEKQAWYLSRVYLLSLLAGVDKVFWFYDRDVPNSTTIFASCGLLRLDGSVRPSGAAIAQLSRELTGTAVVGSVELGEGIYSAVLRRPDGWTVAVWTVDAPRPLPKELGGRESLDIYGNSHSPKEAGPALAYFHLPTLPAPWEAQLVARWLSGDVLTCVPGESVEVQVTAPAGAAVEWAGASPAAGLGEWARGGERWKSRVSVPASTEPGQHRLKARASGAGWARQWVPLLIVESPLEVGAPPLYEPGQALLCSVAPRGGPVDVTARLVGDTGVVAPTEFALRPGRRQSIAVVPSASASGLLKLELTLGTGARQTIPLRPLRLDAPRVDSLHADGDLSEWPEGAAVAPGVLACNRPGTDARVRLAWAPDGLWVAGVLPSCELSPGRADAFWESVNLEVFVDPKAGTGRRSPSCRQFWMIPAKADGGWSAVAGRWEGRSIADDRVKAAVRAVDGSAVFEAFIPAEALGAAPSSGAIWRVGVSMRGVTAGESWEAAWPRLKADGLTEGPKAWGIVGFAK